MGSVRQFGIDTSQGELIALWDSDLYIPRKDWLSLHVAVLLNFPKATTLWAKTMALPSANALAKAYDWYSWKIIIRLVKRRVGFWGGGASIFRGDCLRKMTRIPDAVDEGEDFYIARNLADSGRPVLFSEDSVYHDSHTTFSELIRKDLRRARSFKRMAFRASTGVSLWHLVNETMTVGFLVAVSNLIRKRRVFLALVPLIVTVRLIAYGMIYLI